MLEVCESLADQQPSLEIHPLSIGRKCDPVRLVFNARVGPAVTAFMVDMGHRFRLVVNEVDAPPPDQPLPRLPVVRAAWTPRPDLKTAATAWIPAGGAHHTSFSRAVTVEHLEDFADMEFLLIGTNTRLPEFRKELRWNDPYYQLAHGL